MSYCCEKSALKEKKAKYDADIASMDADIASLEPYITYCGDMSEFFSTLQNLGAEYVTADITLDQTDCGSAADLKSACDTLKTSLEEIKSEIEACKSDCQTKSDDTEAEFEEPCPGCFTCHPEWWSTGDSHAATWEKYYHNK